MHEGPTENCLGELGSLYKYYYYYHYYYIYYINKTRRNWTNKDGRFTRYYSDFRAEVLQIYKFWTQMILGGN